MIIKDLTHQSGEYQQRKTEIVAVGCTRVPPKSEGVRIFKQNRNGNQLHKFDMVLKLRTRLGRIFLCPFQPENHQHCNSHNTPNTPRQLSTRCLQNIQIHCDVRDTKTHPKFLWFTCIAWKPMTLLNHKQDERETIIKAQAIIFLN